MEPSADERAFIKVAEPNVWRLRAHIVWEKRFGPIPKGRIVAYIHRAPDGTETRFDPAEIFILREGTDA